MSSEPFIYLHKNNVSLVYYFHDTIFKSQQTNASLILFANLDDLSHFFSPRLAFTFPCVASLKEMAIQRSTAEVRAGQCRQLRTPRLIVYAQQECTHSPEQDHAAAFQSSRSRKQQDELLP